MSGGSGVLARAVVVLEGDASELDKMMTDAEAHMMKVGKTAVEVGEKLTTHVTLPLLALGALAVHSFSETADAIAKSNAVLRASGGAAGVTSAHMLELAKSLQATTTNSTAVTLSAEAMLLSFHNIRNEVGAGNDVFDQTVKVATDLSALMENDLGGAMTALAKTMEQPDEGLMLLRRANIILSPAIQQTIKDLVAQNRIVEAQKLVLRVVGGAVKDVAAAMAKTPGGQFKQMWNEIHDALEGVGNIIFTSVAPAMEKIKEWAKEFRDLDESLQASIVLIGGVVASIGPLLIATGELIKLWQEFKIVTGITAGTAGLMILAFAAIINTIKLVIENWVGLKYQAVVLWAGLKQIFLMGVINIMGTLKTWLTSLGTMGEVMKNMGGPMGVLGKGLDLMSGPLKTAADGVQAFSDGLTAVLQVDIIETEQTLENLDKQWLKSAGIMQRGAKGLKKAVVVPPGPRANSWDAALVAAHTAMENGTKAAEAMGLVLGPMFDVATVKAGVYEAGIKTITEAMAAGGASTAAIAKATGEFVDEMHRAQRAGIGKELTDSLKAAGDMGTIVGRTFSVAGARAAAYGVAIEHVLAMHVDLNATIPGTTYTWGAMVAVMRKSQLELSFAASQAKTLQQGLLDTANSGLDAFADFAVGAGTSFHEFIMGALRDLTKLLLKMAVLDAVHSLFPGFDLTGLGGIEANARGGWVSSGAVSLVGERGPELISGGRSGLQVTPMPALSSSGGGGGWGGNITVQLTVPSIDQRGVAQFFEENENYVAAAFLRAQQKSSALRNRLGGR